MTQSNQDPFDITLLLIRIWKWKIPLSIVTVGTAIGALIFSKITTPLYLSFCTLFPALPSQPGQSNITQFGVDIHAERLIQLIDSDPVRDSVIKKFNLIDRYQIDHSAINWRDKLMKKYRKRIRFSKTLYTSVNIIVEDSDPLVAAEISNYLGNLINPYYSEIFRNATDKNILNLENEIQKQQKSVINLADSMGNIGDGKRSDALMQIMNSIQEKKILVKKLSANLDLLRKSFGIYDYGFQINLINQNLAEAQSNLIQETGKISVLEKDENVNDSLLLSTKAAAEGAKQRVDYFGKKLSEISQVNEQYLNLTEQIETEYSIIRNLQSEFDQLTTRFNPEFNDPTSTFFKSKYHQELTRLSELQHRLSILSESVTDPGIAAYIISPAIPSYEKSSPHTISNIILSSSFGFITTLIFLLIGQRLRFRIKEMQSE